MMINQPQGSSGSLSTLRRQWKTSIYHRRSDTINHEQCLKKIFCHSGSLVMITKLSAVNTKDIVKLAQNVGFKEADKDDSGEMLGCIQNRRPNGYGTRKVNRRM
jgi:hypothetical protein